MILGKLWLCKPINLLDQLFLDFFKCNLSQFLIRRGGGGWRIYLCVYTVQEHRAFRYLNNDAREDNIKRRGLFDTTQYSKCSNNLNAMHMDVNLLFSLLVFVAFLQLLSPLRGLLRASKREEAIPLVHLPPQTTIYIHVDVCSVLTHWRFRPPALVISHREF